MTEVRVGGSVKFYNEDKGWGFITTTDGDVFVHVSDLSKAGITSLKEGQGLTFEVEAHHKGRRAVKIKLKI